MPGAMRPLTRGHNRRLGLAMLDRQLFDRKAPDAQFPHSQAPDGAALDGQPADRQPSDRSASQREGSNGQRTQRSGPERLCSRSPGAGAAATPARRTTPGTPVAFAS